MGTPACWAGSNWCAPPTTTAAAGGSRWIRWRSFLTYVGDRSAREVRALLGFGWGFAIAAGEVSLTLPAALKEAAWNAHLPTLTATYPAWTFARGFDA